MSFGLSLAESAISGALKSISPFSRDKNVGNINWGDYNYPPCISLVHYDIEDVQNDTLKQVVKLMNRVFLLTVSVCLLNLVDTIIAAPLYADAKWEWVMYSGLNLVVLTPFSMYIFYIGYKGLAINDTNLMQRYSLMGTMQCIFYFIFTIMPFGALNGLLSFAMYHVGVFWGIAIVVESCMWATAFGMALYTVIFIFRGDYLTLPIATRVK
jgi:hypothetical protein